MRMGVPSNEVRVRSVELPGTGSARVDCQPTGGRQMVEEVTPVVVNAVGAGDEPADAHAVNASELARSRPTPKRNRPDEVRMVNATTSFRARRSKGAGAGWGSAGNRRPSRIWPEFEPSRSTAVPMFAGRVSKPASACETLLDGLDVFGIRHDLSRRVEYRCQQMEVGVVEVRTVWVVPFLCTEPQQTALLGQPPLVSPPQLDPLSSDSLHPTPSIGDRSGYVCW